MTGDASEEAAWRELVAHYATPAVADGTPTPWPTREDLPGPGGQDAPGPDGGAPDGGALGSGTTGGGALGSGASGGGPPGGGTPGGGALGGGTPGGGALGSGAVDAGARDGGLADGGGPDTADLDVTGLDMSDLEIPAPDGAEPQAPGHHHPPDAWPAGAGTPGPPHVRIVRPASVPPPDDDDDHFVPPVPPPLPRLDPFTKGAWAALFGGPAYLLVAVMVGWQVPGWAAFCSVAAFIGGFAALVVRMGDRPPRDSGPDDGAVV